MRAKTVLVTALAAAGLLLAAPSGAMGKEPPNQNDPCSTAGRNTCGTNGVGQYKVYRYGIRWFGDFRRAVPRVGPTFCIDLRWWYPAARDNFREISIAGLRNTDGRPVSPANQQRMAYALWTYGRSNSRDQQSAVMLYVHSLMGDGAPGEVDPSAINPRVVNLFRTISRDATRFRGPYRIVTTVSNNLTVGRPGSATIRVISAAGVAVPNVGLNLTAAGAVGVPAKVRTNRSGVARIAFTPNAVTGFRLQVNSGALASTLPRLFKATRPAAARNGQRLVAAALQRVSAVVEAPVAQGAVTVTTAATPASLLLSESNSDRVRVSGAPPGWNRSVAVNVYGPFPTQASIACTGAPVASSALTINGSGNYNTTPFTATQPGWYGYQLVVPGDADVAGLTTPCPEATETFRVQVQPRVRTVVSTGAIRPGETLLDNVTVDNTAGQAIVVNAALYGPFGARDAIRCDTTPVWTGTLNVAADGVYQTDPVPLTTPGFYTYREAIAETELVRGVETTCGDVAETATVIGTPQITTQVSAQQTSPGSQITDKVVVTGLGPVTATVQVELWGPFASVAAISCSGTPFATQTMTVNGDGTYTTAPVTIDRAGVFTYRESLAGGPANDPASTACGEAAETTTSIPAPTITTRASAEVLLPGGTLRDRVVVGGLGKTPGTVNLQLFGPFGTRGAIRCSGTPVGTVQFNVPGDGTYTSPGIRVRRAGFYAFRERLSVTGVPDVVGRCGIVAETALGRPLILTGQGDPSGTSVTFGLSGRQPVRVQVAALNINARVAGVGIDTTRGILNVPIDIQRLGWWRDGATPGDATGSVLIAGHVDSARRGGGAFVRLKEARAGMRIRVTSANGQVRTYRVTRVRRVLKANLPTSIFSLRGSRRLTLVTCGGPFQPASGTYRDNIVVTAVPA